MTAISEEYTSNTSDGVESAIIIGLSSSKTVKWEAYESNEAGVINNQVVVLIKEATSLRFSLLLEIWHRERRFTSSVSNIIKCASYQKIIEMGKSALPLILVQLKQEGNDPDHWFVALETITGEDPIPENAYGNMLKMAEAWLSWAEKDDVR